MSNIDPNHIIKTQIFNLVYTIRIWNNLRQWVSCYWIFSFLQCSIDRCLSFCPLWFGHVNVWAFYSWLLIIHLWCLEAFLRNGRGRLKLVYVILETVDFKHRQCLIVHVSTKPLTTGCTCERLFQKRVKCTKYDIDVCITITGSIPRLVDYQSPWVSSAQQSVFRH